MIVKFRSLKNKDRPEEYGVVCDNNVLYSLNCCNTRYERGEYEIVTGFGYFDVDSIIKENRGELHGKQN